MLLASLRDLEDDRATNKLDEGDYRELQERLSAEAIVVMRRLDELAREHERAEAAAVVPYPAAGARTRRGDASVPLAHGLGSRHPGSRRAGSDRGARADQALRTRRALDGVDLSVAPGESLAVFGPNGAGKTTLLRILTLGLAPDCGTFHVAGRDPRREGRTIRGEIGVISHESYLYDDLTVRQNLEFFGRLYGVAKARERVLALLEEFEMAHRADDAVASLSRGLRQRASLARALVHDPPIVVLDEPFSGLDPHAADLLCETLSRLRRERRTIVLVTHDLRQGLELSDRWVILQRGKVAALGRSAETDPLDFQPGVFDPLTRPVRSVTAS